MVLRVSQGLQEGGLVPGGGAVGSLPFLALGAPVLSSDPALAENPLRGQLRSKSW